MFTAFAALQQSRPKKNKCVFMVTEGSPGTVGPPPEQSSSVGDGKEEQLQKKGAPAFFGGVAAASEP